MTSKATSTATSTSTADGDDVVVEQDQPAWTKDEEKHFGNLDTTRVYDGQVKKGQKIYEQWCDGCDFHQHMQRLLPHTEDDENELEAIGRRLEAAWCEKDAEGRGDYETLCRSYADNYDLFWRLVVVHKASAIQRLLEGMLPVQRQRLLERRCSKLRFTALFLVLQILRQPLPAFDDDSDAIDTLRHLLHYGARLDAVDMFGHSPVQHCMSMIQPQHRPLGRRMAQMMLEKGVDVNTRNGAGETVLMAMVRENNVGSAKVLLNFGADPNVRSIRNSTPLMESSLLSPQIKSLFVASACETSRRCARDDCSKAGSNRCARCQQVYYCSKECQCWHWKQGGHKQACKKLSQSSAGGATTGKTSSSATNGKSRDGGRVIAVLPLNSGMKLPKYVTSLSLSNLPSVTDVKDGVQTAKEIRAMNLERVQGMLDTGDTDSFFIVKMQVAMGGRAPIMMYDKRKQVQMMIPPTHPEYQNLYRAVTSCTTWSGMKAYFFAYAWSSEPGDNRATEIHVITDTFAPSQKW